ncbi:lysine transporter LysE [Azorhizobium oxalatiphilum]|uniref:Lysine transporter LysE n=1 Tax=Azorhizobium oxalatiphilum TaxID=980631 RepID=A0A917FFQ8_9HYPH|nr:LysE family translocator [Azorhizobium oxalatiphilum]GGF77085.1 lysine transporter LysE [Azorhizobium oxalatiphilum]
MAETLPLFLAFALAASVLTLTPGVDTALVLRAAAISGPRSGAISALGIALGLFGWAVAAALGLTALLAASELAFTVVKSAGALYLFVLGARLILKPRTAGLTPDTNPRASGDFRRGLLTNLLNPKVGIFYLTFLPQFIPPGGNALLFSLALASLHVVLSLLWFAVLIAATVPLGRLLARPAVVRALDRLTGLVFVAFGIRLALAQRG